MKERDKLYKLLKRQKISNLNFAQTEIAFKSIKNKINNEIRKEKSHFFKNNWDMAKNDSKKQWKVINKLINQNGNKKDINHSIVVDNRSISDPLERANLFNKYFTNIGETIVTSINQKISINKSTLNYEEENTEHSMLLLPTNAAEINEVLLKLNKNSAAGYDNISVRDILIIKEKLLPILTRLINNIFLSGIFPEVLKIGKVIPIHKAGDLTDIQNYRPITEVCTFSKIIECLMKNRTIKFVTKYIGFDKFQYGFITGSSTLSAATDLINYISTEMDNKKAVITVFVDLKKAFDVVDHTVLLKKLKSMGIRGNAYNIFKTYLNDRPQFVMVDGVNSKMITNNCGVPQGSVLGPLLYSLLVLSLRRAGLTGQYYTFADDTVIVYSGSNMTFLQDHINNDLKKYSGWLLNNRLKLNTDKTVYMVFQQKNTIKNDIELKINNVKISKVSVTKYLGLIIDDKLNWKNHIEKLVNKIVPMLGALYRCQSYLNDTNRLLIYNAYILSNMIYLINIWGTCGVSNLKKIQTIQNKAIKILFHKPYLTPTVELYNESSFQPVKYYISLEQCKQIYKVLHNKLKCNTDLNVNRDFYDYCTRGNSDIHIENVRTNKALFNPITQAIMTYNSVPLNIRESFPYNTFISKIKQHLKTKSYF